MLIAVVLFNISFSHVITKLFATFVVHLVEYLTFMYVL